METLEKWSQLGTNVTLKNGDVYCNCDVVFLGVKPNMLDNAVVDCLKTLPQPPPTKQVLFVSMLAGITLATLTEVKSFFN